MAEAPEKVPTHVAIIMDGNGRWAKMRGLPRQEGHREGAKAVRRIVRGCRKSGVRYLTLYAFSLANWRRPSAEVQALMRLLIHFASKEVDELIEREISVGVIGRPNDLPPATQKAVRKLIDRTAGGNKMRLSLALSYSGRADILEGCRRLAEDVTAGLLTADQIDEKQLRSRMSTAWLPDPDLLIRSGGEMRLSDFLPLEGVYTELFFSPELWPDFTEDHLFQAFAAFAGRQRRFGMTGDQVASGVQAGDSE